MIIYITKKFLGYLALATVAVGFIIFLSGVAGGMELVHLSLFWGATISTFLIYRIFKSAHIWTVYENLLIDKKMVLSLAFLCSQVINIILAF